MNDNMNDPVVVDALRTAQGKNGGAFADIHPADLLGYLLRKIKKRNNLEVVDDIYVGCALQSGEQGSNVGRLASLLAGFPQTVPAKTINRLCGSSQEAIHAACQAILAGDADVIICAGVESMTRVPMDLSGKNLPKSLADAGYDLTHQGLAAEAIATKWKLHRKDADALSLESHARAARATLSGDFKDEILPVKLNGISLDQDEGIRFDPDPKKIASLKPPFKADGIVTAANASQISDGAAAVVVCSRAYAKQHGLKIRARIVARCVVGSDPVLMLTGPIAATRNILKKAGLNKSDIDLYEVNEAFASVVLAWLKDTSIDQKKLNVNGGAIALGHPLGASGARIMTTLVHALEKRDLKYGLMTMCIAYGQATATIIERA